MRACVCRAGVRTAGQHRHHSRNSATAGFDYDSIRFLRTTATTTISSTPGATPDAELGTRHGIFPFNPHPKLAGICDRGVGDINAGLDRRPSHRDCTQKLARATDRTDRYRGSGRREPAFSDDFYFSSSRGQSPEYDESSYRSPREVHFSVGRPLQRNRDGYSRRRGLGPLASPEAPRPLLHTKFCHECGSWYPIVTAKYCCDCGTRRLTLL